MFGIDDVKHIKQMTMNTEITLEINGYKRNILRYGYQFFRNTDRKGRPVTGLLGGNIYVEMESDESSSTCHGSYSFRHLRTISGNAGIRGRTGGAGSEYRTKRKMDR